MFLRRSLYILFLFFLTSNNVFCQKIFRDGYLIKKNGDILNGLVEYAPKQNIPSVCIFKRFDIAVAITYTPGEIREFGYVNGNRYVAKSLDNKDNFYEVMVSGNITLYRKGSKFFLEKGQSGMIELNNGLIEYSIDGEKHRFDDLPSFLKFITEGKAGNIEEKLNPKKDLVPIIAEYCKASGSPYIVYNQVFSEKMLLSESFRSGGNRNSYGVFTGMNIYSLIIKPESEFYIPDPEPEISPTVGLTCERVISRRNDKLALRIDLLFLKQNFYSYSEYSIASYTYRDDAFFDFTGIKLPIMLQYSFTSGRLIPYVNAGISYLAFIQKNYLHIRETESYSHDITTDEDSDMPFYFGEASAVCGAGLKIRIISNIKLNIQGRIEIGRGLFNAETPLKSYKQFSIQPTFLAGITF